MEPHTFEGLIGILGGILAILYGYDRVAIVRVLMDKKDRDKWRPVFFLVGYGMITAGVLIMFQIEFFL